MFIICVDVQRLSILHLSLHHLYRFADIDSSSMHTLQCICVDLQRQSIYHLYFNRRFGQLLQDLVGLDKKAIPLESWVFDILLRVRIPMLLSTMSSLYCTAWSLENIICIDSLSFYISNCAASTSLFWNCKTVDFQFGGFSDETITVRSFEFKARFVNHFVPSRDLGRALEKTPCVLI